MKNNKKTIKVKVINTNVTTKVYTEGFQGNGTTANKPLTTVLFG